MEYIALVIKLLSIVPIYLAGILHEPDFVGIIIACPVRLEALGLINILCVKIIGSAPLKSNQFNQGLKRGQ